LCCSPDFKTKKICKITQFELCNVENIFKGNPDVLATLPSNDWYNENHTTIFVCGAYKTGKTTIISKIIMNEDVVGDCVDNTKGQIIHNLKIENKSLMFFDCEGFYQPSVTIESDFIQKFIINHLFNYGDYIIYVVERMFKHDVELIKEFIEMYKYSDNYIKNFIIIHNYKDIKNINELDKIINKDVITLFDAKIENDEDLTVKVFISKHGQKNIYHYVLGNFTD